MDTTQSFGISSGMKTKAVAGGTVITWKLSSNSSTASNLYWVVGWVGAGKNGSNLLGLLLPEVCSGVYISQGETISRFTCQVATNTNGTRQFEVHLINSTYNSYTNTGAFDQTSVNFVSKGIISTHTTSTANIWVGNTGTIHPSVSQPIDKDLVGVAIRNTSGGPTVSSCDAIVSLFLKTTL